LNVVVVVLHRLGELEQQGAAACDAKGLAAPLRGDGGEGRGNGLGGEGGSAAVNGKGGVHDGAAGGGVLEVPGGVGATSAGEGGG